MGSEDDPPATPSWSEIQQEFDLACETFHALLRDAATSDLRPRSDGTRWNNRQLLFHMLFGYLIIRRLLPLVRFFGRQPGRVSPTFALQRRLHFPPGWDPFLRETMTLQDVYHYGTQHFD